MKTENIAKTLTRLTSNLTSLTPEMEEQLNTVRRVIGYNLLNKRQAISPVFAEHKLHIEPTEEKVSEFNKYIVPKLLAEDHFITQRIGSKDVVPAVEIQQGDLRLPINPIEANEEFRWNQKYTQQIGPFLSDRGRNVLFNLYYYEDNLTIRSQPDGIQQFLFSKAKATIWLNTLEKGQSVTLKAGHVWILGKLLTPQAAANEYIGLNITGGTFSMKNKKNLTGQYLNFDGPFTGVLAVQLEQPVQSGSNFEGCTAAQNINFKYPNEVTFEWQNGNLINITADSGEFDGHGNALSFSNFALPAIYEAALNHIFIPCKCTPTRWVADFSKSKIFEAKVKADITKSFWALPIVRVSNPATLGEADNSGGWGLRLSNDLTSTWISSDNQQPRAILKDVWLLLYPQALMLYSQKTVVDPTFALTINQNFSCWQISNENASRIPFSVTYQNEFLLGYYCHATEGETLLAGCTCQVRPDRPIFAEGSHIEMKDLKGWITFQSKGPEIKISSILGNQEALKKPAKPLALQNALMMLTAPLGLVLEGTLSATSDNRIEKGSLTSLHGLLRWKPILPDPYVSNVEAGWNLRGRELANGIGAVVYAHVLWPQPSKATISFKGDLPFLNGVQIKPPTQPTVHPLPVRPDEQTAAEIRKHTINEKQRAGKEAADKTFVELDKLMTGWKLLDVSTNMDLIGVSISPFLSRVQNDYKFLANRVGALQARSSLTLKELAAHIPLSMVHVFTVPQVQWEPVRTLPEDQNLDTLGWFPEHLSSLTDGGPTRLFGFNQGLAPIIPDVVLNQIHDSFRTGSQAVALTTLSFGLKALVRLAPENTSERNADAMNIVQPSFPKKQMKGGIQINLMAESGSPKFDSRSPGFEGQMVQTLNGYELFTATELGLSVLGATKGTDGSVETQFNKEFSASGSNPFVPVTRFDLSGYGASNFSEWDNPGALASIGKVQFKIMVGRTAFEVVKFVSKIYPWGTTVTRTVTIERRSGGGVIRKDSGWQATQSGIFDFRVTGIPNNPYVFRPGVFRGCYDLKNIRPVSNEIVSFSDPANGNTVELAPVYFDSIVKLDGQVASTVTSRGVLGFIQLSPKPDTSVEPWKPQLLSPEAVQKLITDQGAIGGPLDTMINIGNSGLTFRAARFEVDATVNAGTINFVGVIRGQPTFPRNGSWSVTRMAAPGNTSDPQEAVSADVSKGTPLFIENSWQVPTGTEMIVSSPAGSYRFIDATDAFASQPRYDYGFMQNTGSQAFLFRRPSIVPGTNEISSSLKPAFADPFAMLTSKGVFPPITNAIEFPSSSYKLLIDPGTGKLRLNTAVNLSNPRIPLVLAQDGADQIAIEYNLSNLTLNLNYDDWNVELNNFYVWTTLMGITKFSGARFSLRAGTSRQAKLVNNQSLLKPEIQDALNFLPGMNGPSNLDDIDLGMTNGKHEVKIHAGFEKEIEILPAPNELGIKFSGSTGVDSESDTSTGIWKAFFGVELGIGLEGKVPFGGIFFVVYGLELTVGLGSSVSPTSSSGTVPVAFKSLEIAAYVGVGVGGKIGPFEAQAFIAVGVVFVYEDNTAKLGGLVKLEAEVKIVKRVEIVSVTISAEMKGIIYKDGADTLCDVSGEVAINITLFLIISIDASYGYESTEKLN